MYPNTGSGFASANGELVPMIARVLAGPRVEPEGAAFIDIDHDGDGDYLRVERIVGPVGDDIADCGVLNSAFQFIENPCDGEGGTGWIGWKDNLPTFSLLNVSPGPEGGANLWGDGIGRIVELNGDGHPDLIKSMKMTYVGGTPRLERAYALGKPDGTGFDEPAQDRWVICLTDDPECVAQSIGVEYEFDGSGYRLTGLLCSLQIVLTSVHEDDRRSHAVP